MNMCRDVAPLLGDLGTAGLLADVGELATVRVRLQLRGCRDVGRPFYQFEIVELETGTIVGDLAFFPEPDADRLGTLGHVGGGLRADARGRGLYLEALRAVAPLARQHGLREVVVSFPPDNATAIHAAEKVGLRRIPEAGEHVRFCMPLGHDAAGEPTAPLGT
jgi:RimJ/RimL family protein N-acetyltransferase